MKYQQCLLMSTLVSPTAVNPQYTHTSVHMIATFSLPYQVIMCHGPWSGLGLYSQ